MSSRGVEVEPIAPFQNSKRASVKKPMSRDGRLPARLPRRIIIPVFCALRIHIRRPLSRRLRRTCVKTRRRCPRRFIRNIIEPDKRPRLDECRDEWERRASRVIRARHAHWLSARKQPIHNPKPQVTNTPTQRCMIFPRYKRVGSLWAQAVARAKAG